MRQITRVTALEGAGIEGEVELGPDHWVWRLPNDPIFPGTLMIEAAGQLIALWAWGHGRADGHDWCGPALSSTIRPITGARVSG